MMDLAERCEDGVYGTTHRVVDEFSWTATAIKVTAALGEWF